MKRVISQLCALALFLSTFTLMPHATSYDDIEEELTAYEISILQENLIAYGYGADDFLSDVLFDSDGQASFMLGTSSNGYIVLERKTYKFRECGDGNPYRDICQIKNITEVLYVTL